MEIGKPQVRKVRNLVRQESGYLGIRKVRIRKGMEKAAAKEMRGKATPAPRKRGLCPGRKKRKKLIDQHRTECHCNFEISFPWFPGDTASLQQNHFSVWLWI